MSKEPKPVKIGADGQLYVGDHQPSVMTGNNVKWADDVKYLKILMHSMASADYLGNEGDIEFLDTLPITQAEFHSLTSEVKNRYVNIMKSYQAYFEERTDRIIEDRDGKGDIFEERFEYIYEKTKVFSKKEFEDFKSQIIQGITKQSDIVKLKKDYDGVNKELMIAHKKIKSKPVKKNQVTEDEMKDVIDDNRFKNGKVNLTKVGKHYEIDPDTAKSWISRLRLSDYAKLNS